ncbi:MAG: hypothetical protein A2315_01755 [Ignavibacteria bacterium RIFOXYB2_FULL_35_12]|nr:MAG: hypothetical protein A2058_00205 [Ignavibacteria bacterium GWA2_36_19]OGU51882.1 MAG: hypothetical protein A2006_01780 [Ignavibacteria bacterium GWC2_35_8]OGU57564.1 MAG: hypothetical protein A2X60_00500 [Ignavibacteria bacterium GWF2_35_20]OGU82163.1 MAG: hypothetical protein A2254_08190 [Ignavibacteria bacterium RIFOXYA2_FULL_35_9]OGU87666.1 MAG: hypothetical protein A2492_07755 [Ignavibacteria bacterium RIFOXYC12_FULL_35_11]OGU90952.1 MAG: hypothetical protein A3K31_08440 [Ignavibac
MIFLKDMEMRKKYIASVLVPALFIQLCGCYSMKEISKDEMAGLNEGGDLILHTKDSTIYFFEKSNYNISNDTLYGKGYAKFSDASDFKIVNESAVALTDIERIQRDELNLVTTSLVVGGILLVVIAGIVILFSDKGPNVILVSPAY